MTRIAPAGPAGINLAVEPVNLNNGWDSFISLFDQGGGIRNVLSVIGFAIMIIYFVKWLFDRRRGRGGGFPFFPMILGAVLAAPGALIPLFLLVIGWIITLGATIIEGLANLGGA